MRQNEGTGDALTATRACAQASKVVTGFGEKGLGAEQVAGALVKKIRTRRESEDALGQDLAELAPNWHQ